MTKPSHSRAAVPKETEQSGDILNGSFHSSSGNHGSAADQYYRYMLLKEKLVNKKDSNIPDILKATSEREEIEHQILEKLINITESSPEFAQIVSLTGSSDRFEQARILSEAVYDKLRAEQILGFYTPNKDALLKNFYDKTQRSSEERTERVLAGAQKYGSTSLASAFVDRIGKAFSPA